MRSISSVASDLTLMTSSEPWARATSATTAAASAPSRAQCTVPPARWTASSRRSRWTSRWRSARSLISAPASRSASQSGTSPTTRARLSRIVVVAWPRLRRSWLSASAARAARGKPSFTRPPWPGSRPGASTRTPARAWRRPPPMCIRHELSAAAQTSAPVSMIAPQLVGQHRRRRVGVLDREGAAEAAALLGGRQLDEVEAAHRAQQPHRRVADLQQPQRVARRVVGHAVVERRADVLHPQPPDQELRQLEHARRQRRATSRGERLVAGLGRHPLVALAHHRRARPARRDDRLGVAEHAHEAPHEPDRLVPVARVGVHLPAAGLLEREVDLHADALEHRHRGPPGLREQRVVEAGDEERRPHRRIMPDARA